jgi:hypothetical protein
MMDKPGKDLKQNKRRERMKGWISYIGNYWRTIIGVEERLPASPAHGCSLSHIHHRRGRRALLLSQSLRAIRN